LPDVLLVCPEPLGHGRPAGTGVRYRELARVLSARGHRVTVISADGGAVDGCRAVAISPLALRDESLRHDLAVVQGHAANDLFAHRGRDLFTVVDLSDPFWVEHLHYGDPRINEHNRDTIHRALLRGDFFLCASEPQRLFWIGALLGSGRELEAFERRVAIVPTGVPPPQPHRPTAKSQALLFGTIYEWYDPLLAIEAVRRARRFLPALTLTFSEHPNAAGTPRLLEEKIRASAAPFVRFATWAAYAERAAAYATFSAALITTPDSLENDLSLRTRVIDFLWGGLPTVLTPGGATAALVHDYAAGAVAARDPDALCEAIVRLHDPSAHAAAQRGAERFAAEHQWETVAAPLLELCSTFSAA
jgi:glycosyltransferase involved in cell wall biosynthesis